MLIVDKNIGPCMSNRSDCISVMTKQYFGNKNVYKINLQRTSTIVHEISHQTLFRSITKISEDKNKKRISYSTPILDVDHMRRSIDLDARIPISCGMLKFHKGKGNPPPFKPVVVVVGSPFH